MVAFGAARGGVLGAVGGLIAAAVAAAVAPGCTSDKCVTNLDCPAGRICRLGVCAFDPNAGKDTGGFDATGGDVPTDCRAAAAGDLVMTEILADPGGQDVNGDGDPDSSGDEFVELVNFASEPVSLANVQLSTGGNPIALGARCVPANGAHVVFGADAKLSLTNSGKTVTLLIGGTAVQQHTYGSEADKDQSVTLTVQGDPNSGWVQHKTLVDASWSPGKCPNGNAFPACDQAPPPPDADAGDAADAAGDGVLHDTPPPACAGGTPPVAGDLVINEVLADPGPLDANQDGTADTGDDEYVEIVSAAAGPLDLSGVKVSEAGGNAFAFPPGTCLEPGRAAVVFSRYAGGGDFGGALVFGLGKTFSLNNTADTVRIVDAAGAVLDEVVYGAAAGDDQAITREVDRDKGAPFVKHSVAPLAGGLRMSPGRCQSGATFPDCAVVTPPADPTPDAAGDPGPTPDVPKPPTDAGQDGDGPGPSCGPAATAGAVVLNEILADPAGTDVNGDGTYVATQDEFVEIVNVSGGSVDIGGLTLHNGATIEAAGTDAAVHTFAAGTCLPAKGAVVVFGGGAPTLTAEGATFIKSTKSLSLNNGGDAVVLKDAAGATVDAHLYGSAAGKSWVRVPDGTGAWAQHPAPLPWSPGACADGATLVSCLPPL